MLCGVDKKKLFLIKIQSKTVCLGQPDEIHAEVGSGVLMRGGEWSVDEEPWGNAHVESALTCVEVMC